MVRVMSVSAEQPSRIASLDRLRKHGGTAKSALIAILGELLAQRALLFSLATELLVEHYRRHGLRPCAEDGPLYRMMEPFYRMIDTDGAYALISPEEVADLANSPWLLDTKLDREALRKAADIFLSDLLFILEDKFFAIMHANAAPGDRHER